MTGRARLERATRIVARVPALTLIGVIQVYRYTVSPMTGPTCKYYPSCSTYAVQALQRRGLFAGVALIAWRLLRCNPWSHGGVDDVPGPGEPLFHRHHQTSPATS